MIERILDGVLLVLAVLITTRLVPLPRFLVEGTCILGIGLCFLVGLLIFVAVHKQRAHAVVSEARWASGLRHVVEGIHAMGAWRTMVAVFVASAVYLALQIVPVWALMEGYGLDLSIWAASTVYIVVRLGTAIPNAPGMPDSISSSACRIGTIRRAQIHRSGILADDVRRSDSAASDRRLHRAGSHGVEARRYPHASTLEHANYCGSDFGIAGLQLKPSLKLHGVSVKTLRNQLPAADRRKQ